MEKCLWATQRHNEGILDQAFRTSKEVYLIFSVNKSGEFYGYAKYVVSVVFILANVVTPFPSSTGWRDQSCAGKLGSLGPLGQILFNAAVLSSVKVDLNATGRFSLPANTASASLPTKCLPTSL